MCAGEAGEGRGGEARETDGAVGERFGGGGGKGEGGVGRWSGRSRHGARTWAAASVWWWRIAGDVVLGGRCEFGVPVLLEFACKGLRFSDDIVFAVEGFL